jgi:hypothetical protein
VADEYIVTPEPLDPHVKDMIAGQLDNAETRFAAIAD